MFYHVDWTVSYDPEFEEGDIGELDGINGTPDILERIARLERKNVHDCFQDADLTDKLTMILETTQTIRNMVMMADNAHYISEYPPVKDLLCVLLHLPALDLVVELKHHALEIAEQIVQYLVLDQEDPLYKTLLQQLESTDRGVILTSLRALNRISLVHPTETNKLCNVPPKVIENLSNWLLLNDEDLLDMTTDFLYQYTAVVENLDSMIKAINVGHLVTQLVRLLSHGAKRTPREIVTREAEVVHDPPSETVVPTPRDLLDRLLAMDDPARCCTWIKCFFVEDPESHITQLAIWQAYNTAFLEPLKRLGRPMMAAPEFIKNITSVYQSAYAHIVQEQTPQGPQGSRYLIRGIRPRKNPVGLDGRGYFQCQWPPFPGASSVGCALWFCSAEKAHDHILEYHLKQTRAAHGKYDEVKGNFHCLWNGCTKFPPGANRELSLRRLMAHVKVHVKQEESNHQFTQKSDNYYIPPSSPAKHRSSASSSFATGGNGSSSPAVPRGGRIIRPAETITLWSVETASVRDERQPNAPPQAAGIPLSAVLILSNIARNIVKTKSQQELIEQKAAEGWNERLFRLNMPKLWEIFTENKLLCPYIADLIELINLETDSWPSAIGGTGSRGAFARVSSSSSD